MQEELDKHKTVLRDQEHKFVAQRLAQDATQMMTATCDAGNRISDCRRFSMKEALCVPGGSPHRTKHTELQRNVEQLRHDQNTGSGVRLNLEKEMELLFAEDDALRQESVDRLMRRAEMQHGLQCMTPCRKRVAEDASPLAAEAV